MVAGYPCSVPDSGGVLRWELQLASDEWFRKFQVTPLAERIRGDLKHGMVNGSCCFKSPLMLNAWGVTCNMVWWMVHVVSSHPSCWTHQRWLLTWYGEWLMLFQVTPHAERMRGDSKHHAPFTNICEWQLPSGGWWGVSSIGPVGRRLWPHWY